MIGTTDIESNVDDHVFLAADHAPLAEFDKDPARVDAVVAPAFSAWRRNEE